jgi:hypothetical protein
MAATTTFEEALLETDKERQGREGGQRGQGGEGGEKERVETQQQLELQQQQQQQQEEADEEEEDRLDALIDELASEAGLCEEEEEEGTHTARAVPEEFLQTNTSIGLTAAEVLLRRRKFGLNHAGHEENVILGFQRSLVHPLQFFIGVRVSIV